MKRKTKLLLGIALGLALLAGVGILILRNMVIGLPTPTLSDDALKQATWILQAAETQQNIPSLNNLPSEVRFSIASDQSFQQCWGLLREAVARNTNQYTLKVARVIGEYGTAIPSPVGSTQVILEVNFPDSTLIQMNYYNSTLDECHIVADGK